MLKKLIQTIIGIIYTDVHVNGEANSLQYIFNEALQKQKSYPVVGMSREAYGESGDRVVVP